MFVIICLNVHAHMPMGTNTSYGLKRQPLETLQTITVTGMENEDKHDNTQRCLRPDQNTIVLVHKHTGRSRAKSTGIGEIVGEMKKQLAIKDAGSYNANPVTNQWVINQVTN